MRMMSREQVLGRTVHFANLGLVLGAMAGGAVLLVLEPVLNVRIKLGSFVLPTLAMQIAGGAFILLGLVGLVLFDKMRSTCKACNVPLEEGEAAFPEELDVALRPHLRAFDPTPLTSAPVGSRFGEGPHIELHWCARCKNVGELSLHAKGGGYEFERQLVMGPAVASFAQVCKRHEKVRDATNAQVAG